MLHHASPVPMAALYQAWHVLAQGMRNQSTRATIATQNYVNADSTGSTPQSKPYQRRTVIFKDHVDHRTGTHVPFLEKIGLDPTPFPQIYNPGHPAADVQGMVFVPNINRYFEAADFQEANLQMAGCARLYESTTVMIQRTHDLMIKI